MTTNDDMTPRQPDENEQLEELPGDALDLVDETVARITDADVSEHLRKVLSQSGYTGQLPGRWPPQHRIDLNCPLDAAMAPEDQAMANLAATVRANARLSRESLRQAKKTVDAARQEAEQIVSAARNEADEALKQAAKMVRDAREQAGQIISAARREAEQIVTAARDSHASQTSPFQFLVADFGNAGSEVTLNAALTEVASQPVRCLNFFAPPARYVDPVRQSTADDSSEISNSSPAAQTGYLVNRLDGTGHSYATMMLVRELIALIRGGPVLRRLSIDAGEPARALPAAIVSDTNWAGVSWDFPEACPDDSEMTAITGCRIPYPGVGAAAAGWLPVGPDEPVNNMLPAGSVVGGITSGVLAAHQRTIAERERKTPGVIPPETAEAWHAPPAGGQICAMVAVDIAGFNSRARHDDTRLYLRERLYEVLERAFNDSGIPWSGCFSEDRGDGMLVVIPPSIACKAIIDPLPGRLRSLIRRHNHTSRETTGIRLRAAAHIGPVEHDGHSFGGGGINRLFRMLEARPLKRALAGSDTELALMVSDDMYQSLVSGTPATASRDAFQRVRFQVKHTMTGGWTYLPSSPTTPRTGNPTAAAGWITMTGKDAVASPHGGSDGPTAASAIKRVVLIDHRGGVQYGRDNERYSVYRASLPSVALESSMALAQHLLGDDRQWSRDVFTHNGQASFAGLAGAGNSFNGATEAIAGDTLVIIRNSRGVQVGDGNTQHNEFQTRITNVAIKAVEVGPTGTSRAAIDRLCEHPSQAAAEALASQIAHAAKDHLVLGLTARVSREVGSPVISGQPAEICGRTGVQAGGSARAHVKVVVEVTKVNTERLTRDLLAEARHRAAAKQATAEPEGPLAAALAHNPSARQTLITEIGSARGPAVSPFE